MVADEESTSGDVGETSASSAERPSRAHDSKRKIDGFLAASSKLAGSLKTPARFVLALVGAFLVAAFVLWLVDKFVFYFLARTYIDEVANVLDLNKHLANALVLLTFVVAVFFARYVWSFSKRRRLVGVTGIAALFIAHSLILWYGTRDKSFDREGNAIKCYVLSRDGQVTYGEHVGIDPATGRQCRPVTPEMLERLQKYAAGKRPLAVVDASPVFFDQRSGEPIVWYYKGKENNIEIFDLMGFHPDTGDELLPITKEIAEQWKKQADERARRIPKLIAHPEKYVFFDPRNGDARAWYWIGTNSSYEFYDGPGFQPQTGDKLKVVTREIISDWTDKWNNPTTAQRPPNRVQITSETVFFDPVSGNPRLWYWRRDKGDFEFFDGPGFHPQNGQPLQSFTKETLTQYQQEIAEKTKQIKAEQERIEAEQRAKQEAEARKQADQRQKTEAEQRKREEEAKRLTEAARRCDELAANPGDAHRVGNGVPYATLKPQAGEAVEACENAVKQKPNEPRFQYQLGRALELLGDGQVRAKNRQRALEIHQALVTAGYPAAYDNLASLYYLDKRNLQLAVTLWRRGVDLNDSDSMLSLADLIDKGRVNSQSPE